MKLEVLLYFFFFFDGKVLLYLNINKIAFSVNEKYKYSVVVLFGVAFWSFFFWVVICEARTRHQRCRTSVRHGGTRRRARDAAARASRRVMPCGFHFFKADSRRLTPTRLRIGPIRAESGRFGPVSAVSAGIGRIGRNRRNSRFRPKFKKKKKDAKQTV